jgi:hypothetical protein
MLIAAIVILIGVGALANRSASFFSTVFSWRMARRLKNLMRKLARIGHRAQWSASEAIHRSVCTTCLD